MRAELLVKLQANLPAIAYGLRDNNKSKMQSIFLKYHLNIKEIKINK